MTDYVHAIGGSTTLLIRDTGSIVEFWLQTGSQTWNNQQPWSYRINNVDSATQYFRMLKGGAWQRFGSFNVTYDQDVRFTIFNSGLGFPTYDFVQHITRSTVPGVPIMRSVTPTSSSAFHVVFEGTTDGGSAILEWQIGYGNNSGGPTNFVGSGGTSDVSGFSPGERVYFWARGRNALGWSGWSNRLDGSTWRVPDPPNPAIVSNVQQTSVDISSTMNYDGGTPITYIEIAYSDRPDLLITGNESNTTGTMSLTNATPGGTYYFWVRARNAVGWGERSPMVRVDLIAGAKVLDGIVWKRAVPYLKVAGTWKVVQPWVKKAGEWHKTA